MPKPLKIDIQGVDTAALNLLDKTAEKLDKVADAEERVAAGGRKIKEASRGAGARSAAASGSPGSALTPASSYRGRTAQEWAKMAAEHEWEAPPIGPDSESKTAHKEWQALREQDPAFLEERARQRARYAKDVWGNDRGLLLGVDRDKLRAAGLHHVVDEIEGSKSPTITPNQLASVGGALGSSFAGGGPGVAGMAAVGAMGQFVPEVMAATAAIAALAGVSQYANSQMKGRAIAGAGYNSLYEGYGVSSGSLGGVMSGTQAAFAMRAGINPVGGPFGDNDYAGKQKKALDYIHQIRQRYGGSAQGFDEARRYAEGLGVPEAANAYWLNDYNFAGMQNASRLGADANKDLINNQQAIANNWKGISDAATNRLADFENIFAPDIGVKGKKPGIDSLDSLMNLVTFGAWDATGKWIRDKVGPQSQDEDQSYKGRWVPGGKGLPGWGDDNPGSAGSSLDPNINADTTFGNSGVRARGVPRYFQNNPGMDMSAANAVRLNLT